MMTASAAKKVVMKNSKNSIAYFTVSRYGAEVTGTCLYDFHIEDAEGNRSNVLEGEVKFPSNPVERE